MKDIYLYHLCDNEDLENILKEGLVPKKGPNSRLCYEPNFSIYLCDYKSIPYWSILLDKERILKVDKISHNSLERYKYSGYNEYLYHKKIEPSKIRVFEKQIDKKEAMHELCINYLYQISDITCNIARFYNNFSDFESILAPDLKRINTILNRLDYSVCSDEEIKKILIQDGEEGEYTFADTYLDTDKRLWSQLIEYPEDGLSELRKELYDFIKRTFSDDVLYCDTGGWTN